MVNKKLVAAGVVMSIFAGSLVGCGGSSEEGDGGKATQSYFLNFKPEIADVYKSVAKDYEKETGVKVKVETAASGDYEQTLKSEMAKSEAPTIFQINGPVGYNNWKNYCLDLKDTDLYSHLSDKSLAVTDGDGVYGIPYAVEGYGIIYNQEIMDKYIALSNKKADITSVFFYLITVIINKYLTLTVFSHVILNGVFDLTKGLFSTILISNELLRSLHIIIFFAFGSLSIHIQIKSIISNTSLKYKKFILGRILQIMISIPLFLLLYTIC